MSPYGCNMAFRCADVADLRFDEGLAHYGWLEDRDFAARVGRAGGAAAAALGVHLGVGAWGDVGRRLGYAQIANPLYLLRRRTTGRGDFAAPGAHRSRVKSLQGAGLGRAARPAGGQMVARSARRWPERRARAGGRRVAAASADTPGAAARARSPACRSPR